MLLDRIVSPVELKALPSDDLVALCDEIRNFLIEHVSQSGGHLASNLGVVELTVALHRVFDTAHDRLVFDVGHQCYTHKLLTGRKDGFIQNFRRLNGMAGFPKPKESVHDAFVAGHASTAVSVALGMARARTLLGDSHSCIALLGDGALTGGMAYEALNDAGQSGEPLVVILNDNEMSITRNVGAVASQLAKLRLKPQYFNLKKAYHTALDPLPGGKQVDHLLRSVKNAVKDSFLPSSMFEGMGFQYMGPVDGHDMNTLIPLLEKARDLQKPVLLHVKTVKGKGYRFSEQDPSLYHGIAKFDKLRGASQPNGDCYSSIFGETLTELAADNPKIVAVTAAMRTGTGLDGFAEAYPERFFDVGIAESHAVTLAAGMAAQGLRPVVAIYSSFLQRSYDQIIHDVAIQKLPVTFLVDRSGLVGEDGETHHGVFDVSFLCGIPNMTVLSPASFAELRAHLAQAMQTDGPVAIRVPRGGEGAYTDCNPGLSILRDGTDATLLTYGTMTGPALEAAELLAERGKQVRVVKLSCLKPLETPPVVGKLTVLEDNIGIIGQQLRADCLLNTGDRFVQHGSMAELLEVCRLDARSIAEQVAF